MSRFAETKTLTRAEALIAFAACEETVCDVWCLPNGVFASFASYWLDLDELYAIEREGLIVLRQERVPHALMGPRTPPIQHCSLTAAGRTLAEEARQRLEIR